MWKLLAKLVTMQSMLFLISLRYDFASIDSECAVVDHLLRFTLPTSAMHVTNCCLSREWNSL